MKIIILGAGQVGASLAQTLCLENHSITLIDTNEQRLLDIQERLDVSTIAGHCTYPDVLRQAGAENCDMIIAVTNSDESNMVACQVAYSLFHIPKKIARIRSPHYFIRKELFSNDNLPIDVFISPEQLVTHYVSQLIKYPGALQVLDFAEGKLKLVAVKPYYGGVLLGKSVTKIDEFLPEADSKIVALYRNDHSVELNHDTTIELGDEVFILCKSETVSMTMSTLRKMEEPYKRIMIAGGGNIGALLAESLADEYQVKLIDHDRVSCERLSEKLNNVMILHGDSCDKNLLKNENIEYVDVFCAVTNDDEDNIMSCIQAKKLGVKQVMALIGRTAYVDLIEGGPINIAISPQQSTIGSILAHIRRGDIVNVYSLRRGASEAIEVVAHGDRKTSKVVGRHIADIKLPKEAIIGAIVRGDDVMMANEDVVIESQDHVVLFVAEKKYIKNVEKLFQVSASFF